MYPSFCFTVKNFLPQMERNQEGGRTFFCEDEDFALNQSVGEIKDRMPPPAGEGVTKCNQMYKIQRVLTLMDKNMTLVMAFSRRSSLNGIFFLFFLLR